MAIWAGQRIPFDLAAVLGGIGNIPGAALGGLILGTVETFVNGSQWSTYKDAIAFAILGYQTIVEQCGNVPAVTGARHPALLGCIIPSGPGWLRRLKP